MSNILLKKDYLKKIKLINKYNKFYYDKNNPLTSDKEYDKLKKNILEIEKKKSQFNKQRIPFFKSWI